MPERKSNAEHIIAQIKGLSAQLQTDESPVLSMPAIWDDGRQSHSETCDVVITNQRVIGFYFRSFPREKLFLDTLPLSAITHVTFRQKSYEPVFRELMLKAGERTVYIRAPRNKSEELYAALRSATKNNPDSGPTTEPVDIVEVSAIAPQKTQQMMQEMAPQTQSSAERPAPVYGRQEIRRPFENSPLAMLLLFVGGIILEIIGAVLWLTTGSAQIGLPLCIAGFIAVLFGILIRRQQRKA